MFYLKQQVVLEETYNSVKARCRLDGESRVSVEKMVWLKGTRYRYLILFDTVWSNKHQSPNHKNLSKAT